jgi:hypothetical protein
MDTLHAAADLAAANEAGEPSERERVVRWRVQRLRSGGFPPALAEQLALTTGTDLHALLALVDRGCPPHLAIRIAGPAELVSELA